jgi:hypothetical protein
MNLAAVYYAQGQYTDAARLYQRVLGLQEQVLGPDDPQLIPVLEAKATVHCNLHPVRSLLPWSQRIRWQPGLGKSGLEWNVIKIVLTHCMRDS